MLGDLQFLKDKTLVNFIGTNEALPTLKCLEAWYI